MVQARRAVAGVSRAYAARMERDAAIKVFDGLVALNAAAMIEWDTHLRHYTVAVYDAEIKHEPLEALLKLARANGAFAKVVQNRVEIT